MANEKNKKQPPLEFARIAAAALQNIDTVLAQWVPNGKRQGHEYVALNPARIDQRTGSFSINLNTGAWADFATNDKGGDLIALVAYIERTRQPEACKRLAEFLRIDPHKTATASQAPIKTPTKAAAQGAANYCAVMPIPDAALRQRPHMHPSHGNASHVWEYLSNDGRTLYFVYRFDGVGDRGKTYAPLSFGENKGRIGWNWKAVQTPRPLYRLDKLTANSHAVVILVEGEKAADAAGILFPDVVAMTWPGGAKAINEADFAPLRGREVWYWPDNDASGLESIAKLTGVLKAACASCCSLISLAPFAKYRPTQDANCAALEYGGEWLAKADAADAVAKGWTADHIALLHQRGELLTPLPAVSQNISSATKSETQTVSENTPRFSVNPSGVYCFDSESGQSRRVSAWLEIVARSRSRDGRNWGLLVRFRDHDNIEKLWNIPMSLFGGDTSAEVIRGLYDRGLEINSSRDAKRKVLEYLQGATTQSRVILVEKMGWHNNAFMLPDRVIGTPTEPLHYYSDAPTICRISSAGTLQEWRDLIGMECIDNPLLCFAVCAAFAAPLLDLIGMETSGFHFVGDSSLGKSTLLKVAATVSGNPASYLHTWRATDNALEAMAAAHSDLPLMLDELGQCDPRIAGSTLYMLGNGEGKARANDRGGARDIQHKWRLVFLSSGEKTLEQHMAEANLKPAAGMEMRFLAIPACWHSSEDDRKHFGIYQNLQVYASGADFSDKLLQRSAKYYGTALPAFLEKLCIPSARNDIAEWLLRQREQFALRNLKGSFSGQAKRAADKFAMVGAAGELATEWNITGWSQGEAMRAAGECFAQWVAFRGGEGNREEQQILNQIRYHFETYGESRYTRWETEDARIDEHAARTMERCGFRRTKETRDQLHGDTTENLFYIFPESFRTAVCKGIDYKRAANLLIARSALQHEKGRLTGKARLPGAGSSPRACFIVNYSALCADDESEVTAEAAE